MFVEPPMKSQVTVALGPASVTVTCPVLTHRHRPDMAEREQREKEKRSEARAYALLTTHAFSSQAATGTLVKVEVVRRG